MRPQHYLSAFLLPISISVSALQIPAVAAPFYEALLETNETLIASSHDLLKRDGNCPTNYNSCSTLAAAYAGACCTVGSSCTTDGARNVACCPTGAKCTGTVNIGTATGTGGGAVFGSGTATTTTPAGNTASTATTANTATITSPASVVNNAYFPFPYIPTTYSNSAACMVAYSACQSNYAACTADLDGGGGFAVTIVAPAGGVTVAPTAQNLGPSSATSICSSLYSVGCYGIVPSNCANFGAGTFVAAAGTSAPGSRITAGCYAGMVAAGLGIAGQML